MSESSATASSAPSREIEHPLRNAAYRRWLTGSAISLLGDQFYLVALPWLVLQQLGSARALGTVMMAGALPRVLLMLFGGALSDRISARLIMLTTAIARAACVAAIGALAWLGMLSAWEVYALVIAFGIADAFALPAQSAYVPSLLKREQLVAGTSLGQTVAYITAILGPIPAGLAINALGISAAFLVDAVSFLFVIGALLRLPDPPRAARHSSTLAAIGDGITQVLRDVPLRTVLLLAIAINFCISGPSAVGIAYLARSRLGSSAAYGVLVSALAVGGVLGALAAGVWKIRQRGALILGGTMLLGVCMMVIAMATSVWSLASVLVLMGAVASLVNVHLGAWVMQRIDAAMRGRVSSVLMVASLGSMPISMAVAGLLASWSATGLFVLAGACVLIVAAATSRSYVRRIDQ
jgi:MFS family permease